MVDRRTLVVANRSGLGLQHLVMSADHIVKCGASAVFRGLL